MVCAMERTDWERTEMEAVSGASGVVVGRVGVVAIVVLLSIMCETCCCERCCSI